MQRPSSSAPPFAVLKPPSRHHLPHLLLCPSIGHIPTTKTSAPPPPSPTPSPAMPFHRPHPHSKTSIPPRPNLPVKKFPPPLLTISSKLLYFVFQSAFKTPFHIGAPQ